MLTPSDVIVALLEPFAPIFTKPTWQRAQILMVGAVLTPGRRTVASILRTMGLEHNRSFSTFHKVLSRAQWSPKTASKVLLDLILKHLDAGDDPVIVGIDETVERRYGRKISFLGLFRDPVRSSRNHAVISPGLRWISMMWIGHIPWAGRCWALPFLTVLAPSEKSRTNASDSDSKQRHKTITDWALQMIMQLRRWLPDRDLVVVGDGAYASLKLLRACQTMCVPVTVIARLRLDAALYAPPPERRPGQLGRPRKKGARLPSLKQLLDSPATEWVLTQVHWHDGSVRTMELASGTALWYRPGMDPVEIRWVLTRDPLGKNETRALLCTDIDVSPAKIVEWFALRWQVEVTFQETRKHLGVETQRQWSDKAILRTTPILLGLFSWITLAAHLLQKDKPIAQSTTAWYAKRAPTFIDAIALVRCELWPALLTFFNVGVASGTKYDSEKVMHYFISRVIRTFTYAA